MKDRRANLSWLTMQIYCWTTIPESIFHWMIRISIWLSEEIQRICLRQVIIYLNLWARKKGSRRYFGWNGIYKGILELETMEKRMNDSGIFDIHKLILIYICTLKNQDFLNWFGQVSWTRHSGANPRTQYKQNLIKSYIIINWWLDNEKVYMVRKEYISLW